MKVLLPAPLNGEQGVAMLTEQSQVGLKGGQSFCRLQCRNSGSAKVSDPLFLFCDDPLCLPHASLCQGERIVVRQAAA
jgi:hypothetical protein